MAFASKTMAARAVAKQLEDKKAVDLREIRRLRSTHSLHTDYVDEWNFCLAAYEGGKAFANRDNVFKHARENEQDYQERLKRLHNLNYCAPLVEFFSDFIFADTIQRDGGKNDDFYKSIFLPDVDKRGTDITTFMHHTSEECDIFGMMYIAVDTPRLPLDRKLTKAEEERYKIRPYLVRMRPQEVLDWVKDDFGNFIYLKRVQFVEQMAADGSKLELERYTEWRSSTIHITDVDVTDKDNPVLLPATDLDNTVGEVPVRVVRFRPSKKDPDMAVSFLRDFAYNQRGILNLTSLIDEFLYRQAFNILAMEYTDQVPMREQREGDLGTANVLMYTRGTSAPAYIAPDPSPYDKLAEERKFIISEMYRRAAQDTANELFNGGGASGMSKAMSFSTTVPRIATRAEVLQKAENDLMGLVMRYMTGKTWDGSVKYKDHYEITNLSDALTQLTIIFKDLQIKSESFAKEQLKRVVQEYDGKMAPEMLKKVQSEIDGMNMDKFFSTMTDALVGKKATSPAAQNKNKQTNTMAEVVAESVKKAPGATNDPQGTGGKAKASTA